ncbi:hypothetical protein OBBRIDRAFT_707402, partial [Obba rivulosa]
LTADNTSNNNFAAKKISLIFSQCGLKGWNASEQKLNCLRYIINLAIESFMSVITWVSIIKTKQMIWEYDP